MPFVLGQKSLAKLDGVHPDLVRVAKRAIQITAVDFTVTEGLRTLARQKKLFDQGLSQTMHSRHLTGQAIDIAAWVAGKVAWKPWSLYEQIAEAFTAAGKELGVPVVWGGAWTSFKDGCHIELDRNTYP